MSGEIIAVNPSPSLSPDRCSVQLHHLSIELDTRGAQFRLQRFVGTGDAGVGACQPMLLTTLALQSVALLGIGAGTLEVGLRRSQAPRLFGLGTFTDGGLLRNSRQISGRHWRSGCNACFNLRGQYRRRVGLFGGLIGLAARHQHEQGTSPDKLAPRWPGPDCAHSIPPCDRECDGDG